MRIGSQYPRGAKRSEAALFAAQPQQKCGSDEGGPGDPAAVTGFEIDIAFAGSGKGNRVNGKAVFAGQRLDVQQVNDRDPVFQKQLNQAGGVVLLR